LRYTTEPLCTKGGTRHLYSGPFWLPGQRGRKARDWNPEVLTRLCVFCDQREVLAERYVKHIEAPRPPVVIPLTRAV
jgi:hypothetical protein